MCLTLLLFDVAFAAFSLGGFLVFVTPPRALQEREERSAVGLFQNFSMAEAAPAQARRRPNILITGTPGTGKTCTSELVKEMTGFKYVNVGEVIRTHEFHAGKDPEFDSFILDEDSEDKLLDFLEEVMVGTCLLLHLRLVH